MTKGLVVCKVDDDIEIAARMMGSRQVRRLPVINSAGELAGIVSLGDLARKLDHAVTGDMLKLISD
jgi:CBS domain-containing protein